MLNKNVQDEICEILKYFMNKFGAETAENVTLC